MQCLNSSLQCSAVLPGRIGFIVNMHEQLVATNKALIVEMFLLSITHQIIVQIILNVCTMCIIRMRKSRFEIQVTGTIKYARETLSEIEGHWDGRIMIKNLQLSLLGLAFETKKSSYRVFGF
uniref:Secreted protein n=1 Tax=Heterorhabditis bacteriophora TaxID=37862 RepID=A0A1I7WZR2_HETBA